MNSMIKILLILLLGLLSAPKTGLSKTDDCNSAVFTHINFEHNHTYNSDAKAISKPSKSSDKTLIEFLEEVDEEEESKHSKTSEKSETHQAIIKNASCVLETKLDKLIKLCSKCYSPYPQLSLHKQIGVYLI